MSSTPLRPVPAADARAAVRDAVRLVESSRRAIPAAADRRAAAVAAARHGIEAALATESAEQDAARSALRAGLQRLTAAGLEPRTSVATAEHEPPKSGRNDQDEGDK